MGDDEKLVEKIQAALEDTHAPCVTVIGSPVPMVIGFDFKGFASLVENRTGRPAFGFPATGVAYYDQGQKDAYLAIAARLLAGEPKKTPRAVNILGASVLDGFDDSTLDALGAMLTNAGLEQAAVWGARSSLEEIANSGGAGVNWVVTAAALPLARYLQKRWGTPFVAGLPIGKQEQERLLAALASCAAGREPEFIAPANNSPDKNEKTLIVGEALFCSSLRACLEAAGFSGAIKIATFFSEGKELLRPDDLLFRGEEDAEQALSRENFKTVVADPLIAELLPPGVKFIGIPHRAVSGRIYHERCSRFFGEQFRSQLKGFV
jgi:nitrogenase molybdenum-iron protein alpha/beta subunit